MEFQEVVRRRRMVRSFEPRPLPAGALERILANGLRGPSAGFSQGFEFLVLNGPEQTARFWRSCDPDRYWERAGWPGVYNAAALIVPCAHMQAYLDRYRQPDKKRAGMQQAEAWPVPYWHIDTGFAALLMLLTAVDEGLGAVFYGPPPLPAFRAEFGVPEPYTPIGVIALGYPAPDHPSGSLKRGHRPQAEVMHRGQW
jgi:nitroreductase